MSFVINHHDTRVSSFKGSSDTGRQVVVCVSRHDQLATWITSKLFVEFSWLCISRHEQLSTWSTGKQYVEFIWLLFLTLAMTCNASLLP